MPSTMPTCEHTPTEPRTPIGEISVMYEPATICATPATTPMEMRPSTRTHQTVPRYMSAEERKTKKLASSSVFFRPKYASGTTTPYEPIRPPTENMLLISAHCHVTMGFPAAARSSGTICSRLFSDPVAKPNCSEEPRATAVTVAKSLSHL